MGWGSGNLGGGSAAWAMVIVNYPSGSKLTATNVSGKKDLSSTQRLYYVKKPTSGTTQSCKFTSSYGTQSKSQTVSNITIGTSQTITLTYALEIYNLGDVCTSVTGGWSGTGYSRDSYYSNGTLESDHIYITGTSTSNGGFIGTVNSVDLSEYNTLYVDYIGGSGSQSAVYVTTAKANYYKASVMSAKISTTTSSSRTTVSTDISTIDGGYIAADYPNSNSYIKIYRIWAE